MTNINNKVSIIVPTYKRNKDFLKRSLDSLINQSYFNIEIIIVDDNESESEYRREVSSFIISEYQNFDFIIYHKNKYNMGGALARNEGVKLSTGQYITFLDDDDIYLKHKINNQLNFMLSKNLDMSFSNLIIKDENNKIIDYREFSGIKNFDSETLLKYHLINHITGTPTFMYKKDFFNKISGFDKVVAGQEFFLMLKTIENGANIGYLNSDDVVSYAHTGERISVGKNKIIGEKYLLDYKKKYFNKLVYNEKKYILFRHYAVISLAYLRNKNYIMFFKSGFKGFFIAPIYSIRELFKHINKLSNKKNDITGKEL